MDHVARQFDQHSQYGGSSADQDGASLSPSRRLPWTAIRRDELPPMMFQLRFSDGRMQSFAYSDIREVRCPDAGSVQVYLYAMDRLVITLEGRHLRELANLLTLASIRTIDEADPRDTDVPERDPEIVRIRVEAIGES